MISIDFVNGTQRRYMESAEDSVFSSFKNEIDDLYESTVSMIESYALTYEKYMIESEIMGELSEQDPNIITEGASDILTKIGETVISICKKFVDFIEGILDKLKSFSFSKKSDIAKMEVLVKKHPELKEKIIASFSKGELELSDIKTLKELDKAFEDIVNLSKKSDVKPGSLKDKWNKAMDKIDSIDKSKAVKVAAATTTVITAGVAITTLSTKILEAKKKNIDCRSAMSEYKEKLYSTIKDIQNDPNIPVDDKTGKAQTLLAAYRTLAQKHSAAANQDLRIIDRLENAIAKFADSLTDKFDANAHKQFQNDVTQTVKNVKDKTTKAAADKLDDLRKSEEVKQKVQQAYREASKGKK